MQYRKSLFRLLPMLGLAAASFAAAPAASAAPADTQLVNGNGPTLYSYRDMVQPAYWVMRHHHRIWVPNRRHR